MITRAAINVVAAHRLTTLVVEDEITRPIRDWVHQRFPDSRLDYGINCRMCTSVWAGFVVLGLPSYARRALAVSAGVLAVDKLAEIVEMRATDGVG